MGKWLNGARVRKREIDGKDTRIVALAAAGVVTAMEHQPPGKRWHGGHLRRSSYP